MKSKVSEITLTDDDGTNFKVREWHEDRSFAVLVDSSDCEILAFPKEKAHILIEAINSICDD